MSNNQVLSSFVAVLYHVGQEVQPVNVVTGDFHFGRNSSYLVMEKSLTAAYSIHTLAFKFDVRGYYPDHMSAYVTCVDDIGGYRYDLLSYSTDWYVCLESDLWRESDAQEDNKWMMTYTGEVRKYNGEERAVFTLKNMNINRYVEVVRQNQFTYLKLTPEASRASHFMFRKVKDIEFS
ncbi:hypothetical protein [Pseudomonas sp. xss_2]|uniref:hypothetical protein n=1 Tax=Pseudomonas sp. xss_2 TaxID=3367215 RepID=UPI00370B4518